MGQHTHTLRIRWTTSRGAETYGYTVASLYEFERLAARCKGGGYDMRGTVFGEWLEKAYPDRLAQLRPADAVDCGYGVPGWTRAPADRRLYGLTWRPDGSASLDGGCGFESMCRVAEAIGLDVTMLDAGRHLDILTVRDTRESEAA